MLVRLLRTRSHLDTRRFRRRNGLAGLHNRIAEVLGSIKGRFVIALIISSAVFGLAHYDQGITGVTENIIDGAFLALLYLATGRNLWAPILAHGITDTVDCILLYSGHYRIR